MYTDRPIVMSIAGLDPSGGAGLLADIKTFEMNKVYGLGVCTAITLQTESEFLSGRWEKIENIVKAIEKMLLHYEVKAIKIGLVENLGVLKQIVTVIYNNNRDIKIVVDPIMRSSTGFTFWGEDGNNEILIDILSKIYLLTPNFEEAAKLHVSKDAKQSGEYLSNYCNVLLKGGHNSSEPAIDYLFTKGISERILPENMEIYSKHGSGCVLASAITANLAAGFDLIASCKLAKGYMDRFFSSNETLLGYHNV